MVKFIQSYPTVFESERFCSLSAIKDCIEECLKDPLCSTEIFIEDNGVVYYPSYAFELTVSGKWVCMEFSAEGVMLTTEYKVIKVKELNSTEDDDDILETIAAAIINITDKYKVKIEELLDRRIEEDAREARDIVETEESLLYWSRL
jgi:hypothetical protein